jgi:primosomal protein N' (replication factor Y)
MSERLTLFVDVVIPVPIHRAFTYRVPFELNDLIQKGVRVIVPFGKSKLLTGLVIKVHDVPPKDYTAKYIEHQLDEIPIVTNKLLQFWSWMSEYYMAAIGDVMNAALPSNFKLASETKVTLHPDFDDSSELDDREFAIVEALEIQEVLDLKEITAIAGIKTIQPIIKKMLDKKILISLESISDKFVTKTVTVVTLHPDYLKEEALNSLLSQWGDRKSKEKQQDAILALLSEGNYQKGGIQPVPKRTLEDRGISPSTIKTLHQNQIVEIQKMPISRLLGKENDEELPSFELSESQQVALDEIKTSFQEKRVCLLHGVTGSGKTEVYVKLIEEQLEQNKQVLFLVPEIALTTQLIQRLTKFFGQKIGVYHSKFNQNERVEIWNKVLENDPDHYRIVLGARSCVFLPFQNLGLIIVDEEHESSFKQYDPSPRYHGRDSAIVLGHMHDCQVLLGSATPSLETNFNCQNEKYGIVKLSERFRGMEMPEIMISDLKKERTQNPDFQYFTTFMIDSIREALKLGEQVILFQNRRGYNPRWQCEICNWTPVCVNCDVSLTYHKKTNSLKCHYCGHHAAPMGTCKSCGSNRLKMIGFGTEKIEDEMSMIFPDAVLGRLDLDTTRNKNGYENIINSFANRQIDILIGTQMISKGLDFDNVSLVGIMDSDDMLNRPDFRAFEKSFQMMTQVAGRAGRKYKRGKVIVQAGNIEHWVLEKVHQHDYETFYEQELIERENFQYPPFYKMIDFTLKHRDERVLDMAAKEFTDLLRSVFKQRVMGPEYALVPRINNQFIKITKLKIEKTMSDKKVKETVHHLIDQFYSVASNKSVRLSIDVDPL